MLKLLIVNNFPFHFEIIESVIIKYYEILNISKDIKIEIYLKLTQGNYSFLTCNQYLMDKYPKLKFEEIEDYDYYIDCTIYDIHFDRLNKELNSREKYISHEITDRLKTNPNVYYLTPLAKKNFIYADILPFADNKIISDVPIYIIQVTLCHGEGRRHLNLLHL